MMRNVHTKVTLEPDLIVKLRSLARKHGISFDQALNDALRAGVAAGDVPPYRLPTRALGLRRAIDLNKGLQLAGDLEDAETIRKLELRN